MAAMVASESFASRWLQLNQASVRSTTHRRSRTSNPRVESVTFPPIRATQDWNLRTDEGGFVGAPGPVQELQGAPALEPVEGSAPTGRLP